MIYPSNQTWCDMVNSHSFSLYYWNLFSHTKRTNKPAYRMSHKKLPSVELHRIIQNILDTNFGLYYDYIWLKILPGWYGMNHNFEIWKGFCITAILSEKLCIKLCSDIHKSFTGRENNVNSRLHNVTTLNWRFKLRHILTRVKNRDK